MDPTQALTLVRQACEAHATNWQQHQLMQEALATIEAAVTIRQVEQQAEK